MSAIKLRHHAKAVIDTMSAKQLKVASEFLTFIKSRQADSATLELFSIPDFEASFSRGIRDIKSGRTKPWRKVRSRQSS